MSNDKPNFFVKVRGFIGHIAWRVFLWSIKMTEEQYNDTVHIGCEPVAPMKYWQHEDTGRLCASQSPLSDRWYEITEEQYNHAFARAYR